MLRRALALGVVLGALGIHRAAQAGDSECFKCHAKEKYSSGTTKHQVVPCNGCHAPYVDTCSQGHVAPPVAGTLTASVAVKGPKSPAAAAECKACHAKQFGEYEKSVHGRAFLVEKKTDSAYCFDCHGSPHELGRYVKEDRIARALRSISRCLECHGKEKLSRDHNLSIYIEETYRDSIHLRTLAIGEEDSATCADCHGSHDIRSKKDPQSTVSSAKVAETCAKCHPGATPEFAAAFAHRPYRQDGLALGFYITQFFTWVTFMTMGLLVLHGALDFLHALRHRKSHAKHA